MAAAPGRRSPPSTMYRRNPTPNSCFFLRFFFVRPDPGCRRRDRDRRVQEGRRRNGLVPTWPWPVDSRLHAAGPRHHRRRAPRHHRLCCNLDVVTLSADGSSSFVRGAIGGSRSSIPISAKWAPSRPVRSDLQPSRRQVSDRPSDPSRGKRPEQHGRVISATDADLGSAVPGGGSASRCCTGSRATRSGCRRCASSAPTSCGCSITTASRASATCPVACRHVQGLGGARGARPEEPLEVPQAADVEQVSHVPFEVGRQVPPDAPEIGPPTLLSRWQTRPRAAWRPRTGRPSGSARPRWPSPDGGGPRPGAA